MIIAGAVFLCDPFIGVFDVLPDCVGYLLFALGLTRLSDMDDRLSEVFRAAKRLALVGLARLLAVFLTFGLISPSERPVFILLVVFTLGILDLLLVIPLWKHFAGGLIYLGSRNDSTALLDRTLRSGCLHERNLTERYVGFSTFYFVLREMLVVLPEMTVLTHEQGGAEWSGTSLYNYVGFFRVAGYVLSLAFGLVWLIKTISFIRRIKRDTPFVNILRRKYETEVLSRHDLFAMRAVKASLVSLSAATVLSLDLYVEGVSILPDILAAVLLLFSLGFLRHYEGKHILATIAAVAYGLSAAVTSVMQVTYVNHSDIEYALDDPATADRLSDMSVAVTITSALFLVAFFLTLHAIWRLAKRHTGVRALREGSVYAAERTEAIHRRIRRKILVVGIFATLTALSAILQWAVIPYLEPLDFVGRPSAGDVLFNMFYDLVREAYWSLDLIFGGALVAVTVHACSEVFEQMDHSYLMNQDQRA